MSFRKRKQCTKCGCNYIIDGYSLGGVILKADEITCPNCQIEMKSVDIGIYESGSEHVYRRKNRRRGRPKSVKALHG